MNIDELTVKQVKEIAALINGTSDNSACCPFIGKFVIVRTYSAGVHIGELERCQGAEVLLKDTRRIWSWSGAFTLSKIAEDGISSGKLSKIIPYNWLTQAIEIIPASENAEKQLKEWDEYTP